jgi:hypothetical protein
LYIPEHGGSSSLLVNHPDLKITILRSNSNPALPYIRLLIFFNLLTCPSTCPLLYGVITALLTASKSDCMPLAKRFIADVDFSISSSHVFNVPSSLI